MARGPAFRDPVAVFLRHADDSGGVDACWEWRDRKIPAGYGVLSVFGRETYAHRFAYELFGDKIPAGLQIDHLCRNRSCVNPAHLEPVTQRENSMRGESVAARNARKTRCANGHTYDAENTRITPAGSRVCRTCHRERERRRHREMKKARPV